jgi:hypothetical protein
MPTNQSDYVPQNKPINLYERPLSKGMLGDLASNQLPKGAMLTSENYIIGLKGMKRRPGLGLFNPTSIVRYPPLMDIITLWQTDGQQITLVIDSKFIYTVSPTVYYPLYDNYMEGTARYSGGALHGSSGAHWLINDIYPGDELVLNSGGTTEIALISGWTNSNTLALSGTLLGSYKPASSYAIRRAFKLYSENDLVDWTIMLGADDLNRVVFADGTRKLRATDGSTFGLLNSNIEYTPRCVLSWRDRLLIAKTIEPTSLKINFKGSVTYSPTSTTVTLDSNGSLVDDLYNESTLYIDGGTGSGQSKYITDYYGTALNYATGTPMYATGNAVSATGTTVVLAVGSSAVNDYYNNNIITIVSGTGSGQIRVITDYVGATRTCTVPVWSVNPDATSVYKIGPATTTSFVLEAGSSASDDFYNGFQVSITTGVGVGQTAIITDYVGATRTCTVTNWGIIPTGATAYAIQYQPRTVVTDAWGTRPDSTSTYQLVSKGIVPSVEFLQRFRWSTVLTNTEFDPLQFIDLPYTSASIRRIVPLGNMVVLYFHTSIWIGRPTNIANDSLPYYFEKVDTGGVGLVGMKAVTTFFDSHFFVGQDDIYMLSLQGSIQPLGMQSIKDALDACHHKDYIWACSDPDNSRLVFGFPQNDTSMVQLWSYEYKAKAWSYDLVSATCLSRQPIFASITYDDIPTNITYDSLGTYDTTYDEVSPPTQSDKLWLGASGQLVYYTDNGVVDVQGPSSIISTFVTPDYDLDYPDDDKTFLRLTMRIEEDHLDNITFAMYGSNNYGVTWRNLGNLIIRAHQLEGKIDFKLTGSAIRFKGINGQQIVPFTITELGYRISVRGTEVNQNSL